MTSKTLTLLGVFIAGLGLLAATTQGCGGGSGGAGTAGSGGTGTGGVTGMAGTVGSTCDTACMKADDCCNAVATVGGNAGVCMYKVSCDSAGDQTASVVAGCNSLLASASYLVPQGTAIPDACK